MKRLKQRLRSSSSRQVKDGSTQKDNGGSKDSSSEKENIISYQIDVMSKRGSPLPSPSPSPSPQASLGGTSISSNSGNFNSNIASISSISSIKNSHFSDSNAQSLATSRHGKELQLDHNLDEKSAHSSMRSQSLLSDSTSSSKESTLSNGSSIAQDSFVVMSTTGLSSVESSVNSFYCYNPFTGKHNVKNARRAGQGDDDNAQASQSSTGNTTSLKHNYLHTKERSSHLPRLTLPSSAHTQRLLQKTDHPPQDEEMKKTLSEASNMDMNISPQSRTTANTELMTPGDSCTKSLVNNTLNTNNSEKNSKAMSDEFPISPLNTTPNFHIPLKTSFSYQTGGDFNSSFSSNVYNAPNLPHHEPQSYYSNASNTSSKQLSRENKILNAAIAEKEFWMRELRETTLKYGSESVETARQLNNLGSTLLRCKEYNEAFAVYRRMIGIIRRNFDGESLAYARALDKVGLAASKCPPQENLEWALLALNEALHLRISQLGPHHCDTVDTLNNIAGIFLHMKEWSRAKDAYVDVMTVRAAIFGSNHPSVAVTAQTLGKVCSHLSDFDSSLDYYELALNIYRGYPMMLKDRHPIVKKILRNIDRTNRLMSSLKLIPRTTR